MPCQMISATCYINSYAHVREWLRKGSKRTTATTNLQSNENARRAGGRARSLCHRDCRLPTNQPTDRGRTDHRTKLTSRRRRRQFIDCQFVTTPSTQACPRRGGESPDRLRDRSRESCATPLSPLALTGGGRRGVSE